MTTLNQLEPSTHERALCEACAILEAYARFSEMDHYISLSAIRNLVFSRFTRECTQDLAHGTRKDYEAYADRRYDLLKSREEKDEFWRLELERAACLLEATCDFDDWDHESLQRRLMAALIRMGDAEVESRTRERSLREAQFWLQRPDANQEVSTAA